MSRASKVSLIALGVVLVASGLAVVVIGRANDTTVHVGAGIVMAGLLVLPSVAGILAAGVKTVGGALADAWRAKEPKP